ncbi:hypothetical protein [Risungbinella massiliensis]|nr:hypothetical protein [Risungbinella massiliensis]
MIDGETDTQTITYLGKQYTVPKQVKRIVIVGSMESQTGQN